MNIYVTWLSKISQYKIDYKGKVIMFFLSMTCNHEQCQLNYYKTFQFAFLYPTQLLIPQVPKGPDQKLLTN